MKKRLLKIKELGNAKGIVVYRIYINQNVFKQLSTDGRIKKRMVSQSHVLCTFGDIIVRVDNRLSDENCRIEYQHNINVGCEIKGLRYSVYGTKAIKTKYDECEILVGGRYEVLSIKNNNRTVSIGYFYTIDNNQLLLVSRLENLRFIARPIPKEKIKGAIKNLFDEIAVNIDDIVDIQELVIKK